MEPRRAYKRYLRNPEVRIKRRKVSPTLATSKEEAKVPTKESASSTSTTLSEREERDRAIMELLKETENFDPSNNTLSPFIHGPEYVEIISPANNFARNIPTDEPRPCSFSVRQEHYQNILQQHSRQNLIRRRSPQYFSHSTNLADLNTLLDLQTRELTPADYGILLALDSGLDPHQSKILEVSEKLINIKFESMKRNEGEQQCVICMEDFREGEILTKLPCRHLFHKKCFEKWIDYRSICPIDKTEL